MFYSYGREYADPYLGHGIGPMASYGVSIIFYVNNLKKTNEFVLLKLHIKSTKLYF